MDGAQCHFVVVSIRWCRALGLDDVFHYALTRSPKKSAVTWRRSSCWVNCWWRHETLSDRLRPTGAVPVEFHDGRLAVDSPGIQPFASTGGLARSDLEKADEVLARSSAASRSMRNTGILPLWPSRLTLILAWRREYGVDSPCDEDPRYSAELLRSLPLRVVIRNRKVSLRFVLDAIRFGDAPRVMFLRLRKPTIFSFSRACSGLRSPAIIATWALNTGTRCTAPAFFQEKSPLPLLENRIHQLVEVQIMLVVLQKLSRTKATCKVSRDAHRKVWISFFFGSVLDLCFDA